MAANRERVREKKRSGRNDKTKNILIIRLCVVIQLITQCRIQHSGFSPFFLFILFSPNAATLSPEFFLYRVCECVYGWCTIFAFDFSVHSISFFQHDLLKFRLCSGSVTHIHAQQCSQLKIQRLQFIKRRCWKLISNKRMHKPQTSPQFML